jgi:hypothetical protein
MSTPIRWIAGIVLGLAIVTLVAVMIVRSQRGQQPSAPGHWPEGERKSFVDACVVNCRKAPGVTADRYSLCDQACTCAADEGEKVVSSDDLVAIYTAQQSGKVTGEQNQKLEQLKSLGLACAARTAGNRK